MYQSQKEALTRFLRSRAEVDKMSGVLANMIKEDRNVDAVLIPEEYTRHINELSNKTGLMHSMFKIGDTFVLCYPKEEREKYMEIREESLAGGKRLLYPDLSYAEMKSALDMMKAAKIDFHVNLQTNGRFEIMSNKDCKEEMDQIIDQVNAEKSSYIGKKVYIYRDTVFAHAVNQTSYALMSSFPAILGNENGTACISLTDQEALITNTKGEQRHLLRESGEFEKEFTKAVLEDLGGDRIPIKVFFGAAAERLSSNFPPMTLKSALEELNINKIPSIDKLEHIPEEIRIQHPEAYAVVERASCFCTQKVEEVEKCRPKPEEMREYADMHKQHIKLSKELYRENDKGFNR